MKKQTIDGKINQIKEGLNRSIEMFKLALMIQVGSVLLIGASAFIPNYLVAMSKAELIVSSVVLIIASQLIYYCIGLQRYVNTYLHFTDDTNVDSIPSWASSYFVVTLVIVACDLTTNANALLVKIGTVLFITAFCFDFAPAVWKYKTIKKLIETKENDIAVQSINDDAECIKEAQTFNDTI